MKHALLHSTLLALAVGAGAPALQSTTRARLPSCPNDIEHEPLVVYEVTGGTLSGPVDAFLAVYDDGLARYSSSVAGSGPGSSQSVTVGDAARTLQQALIAAGAMEQCDRFETISDMPLSTLTVLRDSPRGRPNSFSWFVADGDELGEIESLLQSFIAEHFDPLPPGGNER